MRWSARPGLIALPFALALAAGGCKAKRAACASIDAEREPARALEVCKAELERSGDGRAAVAVVDALTAQKDDAGIIAWAARVGDRDGAGKVWRRAAQAHERRGELEPMMAALARSMPLWERAKEPGEAAYDAHLLRQALFEQGKLLPALEMARRERRLALSSDDAIMQWGSFLGLFAILDEIGDYAGAKALLREQQERTDPKDTPSMRALRFCEGLMFFREGRLELAKLAYRDALAMVDPTTPAEDLRPDYYNLVEIEVLLGDLAAAQAHLATAVASVPADAELNVRSARAFFTALVLRGQRDLAGAEAAIRPVLTKDTAALWAWQLEELLGKVLEEQGRGAEALEAYRRSIAVIEALRKELAVDVLQVALRERKRAPYEAAFDLLARKGEVAAAMQMARAMWQRGFVEAFDVGSAEGGDGGGRGGDASAERLRGLAALAPQLEGKAERATEGQGGADVLAFVEARGGLWRYQRRGEAQQLEQLKLPAGEAKQLVAALRAKPDDAEAVARLSQALLPVLSGNRTRPLAVIADGALAGLPFAALRLGPRFLVEERTLLYWPSLEHVGQRRASAVGEVGRVPAAPAPVAVLAPSSGLAAARREAVELSLVLGAAPVLDDKATIAALRSNGGARLLHLAAHGGLSPGGAFVRMADGEVTATDIVTWKLAPRVVVLASCASGARPSGSMWGALGGAFLAAGSEWVVATLWSVEDAAAASLVRAFYAAGGEKDPARALAEAQRAAIAAGVSPRQWAAFVALGES